jgi:hypothetical protein
MSGCKLRIELARKANTEAKKQAKRDKKGAPRLSLALPGDPLPEAAPRPRMNDSGSLVSHAHGGEVGRML